MSEPASAAPLAAARPAPTHTPASRLRRERDNLVIDSLNRGLSMAEIADQIGVSDKRMRALVREIFARPETPSQGLEKIDSAPGISAALEAMRRAASMSSQARHGEDPRGAPREDDAIPASPEEPEYRPGTPSQGLEKIDSAPGLALPKDEEAALSEELWERESAPMDEAGQGPPPLAAPPRATLSPCKARKGERYYPNLPEACARIVYTFPVLDRR